MWELRLPISHRQQRTFKQQRAFKVIAYLYTPIDVIQHAKYTRRNYGEENPPSDKVVEYHPGGGGMRSLCSRI
jgi:hypothetical protein